MKRFVVVLFFLIALGAVIFFFGWIQFRIPAGSVGVIFTKTSGWEEAPLEPGSFLWRWQRLIPTNLTLYVFDSSPHTTQVRITGALPSAEAYEELVGLPGSMDYVVDVAVTSVLRAAALPRLAQEQALRPEEQSTYLESLDARITNAVSVVVASLLTESPESLTISGSFDTVASSIRSRITTVLPELEVLTVVPNRLVLPDMALYSTARELSRDVMQARADAMSEAAREVARENAESLQELEMLAQYGAVLDQHPILLEYFRMGNDLGADPLSLEGLVPATTE